MEILGGKIGELFSALAFAAAAVAAFALIRSEFVGSEDKKSWVRLGLSAFWVHALSIIGIVVTLFTLIYTHQYNYHYVWAHSSNELPVHFMISCFWEGQEGSFLLWCFWHSILGLFLIRRATEWRNLVLGIIATVELILSSMLLGAYVDKIVIEGLYLILALVPLAYFGYKLYQERTSGFAPLNIASFFLSLATLVVIGRNQTGFLSAWNLSDTFQQGSAAIFSLGVLFFLLYAGLLIFRTRPNQPMSGGELMAHLSLFCVAIIAALFEEGTWKVGSTPFLTLKAAMPDAPIWQTDPNFIPSNGSGLNPLLQNYWMVIHPPTLFLGFAATVVPFAFVLAGLIKRRYEDWIRPALPWTVFSIMILGVGILMGGYWAYETLNFGGYWNWDPVENSSLVPWLFGIAGLHAMLIYQRSKAYLRMTMIFIVSTFLLVLYSTFLTRSGILGETSVHTFTDLGLSGQLLVLVLIYLAWPLILFFTRWNEIPRKEEEAAVWSSEFMLFLGVMIFTFAGAEIILTTSLPVINEIFGTRLAPPANIQLFYYQWNVWFAIGFGILSGLGQFLWWKVKGNKTIEDALFRPFAAAAIAGSALIILLLFQGKEFAFNDIFGFDKITGNKILGYAGAGIMRIADELLLFSALFGLLANLDVLRHILVNNKKRIKVMGGTVAHIGFALMLLGMLFSSGYDEVLSKNIMPEELAGFPDDEKMDNVALVKNDPRPINGYRVTYLGKREAKAPVKDLDILEATKDGFKLKFRDSVGDAYALVLPRTAFMKKDADTPEEIQPVSDQESRATNASYAATIDLQFTEEFLNKNLANLKPEHINGRNIYRLHFASQKNPDKTFLLEPETETGAEEGLISHPDRKLFLDSDIYLYISSVPKVGEDKPEYRYHEYDLKVGDKVQLGKYELLLAQVRDISDRPDLTQFQVAATAHMLAITAADTFFAAPIFVIDAQNKPGMVPATINELHLDFAFVSVDPSKGTVKIQVQELANPDADWIVFKAIKKPYINLLWLGTLILTAGFLISIYRRIQENKLRV